MQLARANALTSPDLIRVGMRLVIPGSTGSAPAPAPKQTATTAGPPPTTPEPTRKSVVASPDLPPQLAGWPDALLKLINEQRAAYKLPAVTWSPELASAAQAHAEDCARRNSGSHVGSDGAILLTRLARAGYAAHTASENWANARNVQGTFSARWNEPPDNDPHRRSILDARYKEVGIGIAPGGWGYYFVADFGSR